MRSRLACGSSPSTRRAVQPSFRHTRGLAGAAGTDPSTATDLLASGGGVCPARGDAAPAQRDLSAGGADRQRVRAALSSRLIGLNMRCCPPPRPPAMKRLHRPDLFTRSCVDPGPPTRPGLGQAHPRRASADRDRARRSRLANLSPRRRRARCERSLSAATTAMHR